jgi:subtilase family serine protease
MKTQSFIIRLYLVVVLIALTAGTLLAQANAVPALVNQPLDLHNLVTLHGYIHPLAEPEFDQGGGPDDLPVERMLLLLKRSDAQETALRQLLDNQQVKASGQFHQWLTPKQFGQQFGPADSDVQAVTSWLSSQGFQLTEVSAGKTVIEFSGSAGLVRQVLGTSIHRFLINGKDYWANTSDPQIPSALAPVVSGFASFNNFPHRGLSHIVDAFSKSTQTGKIQPLFTVPTIATANVYAVAPYDFATIYNVLPLWNAGIDGTGQTIAIVGETDINLSDVIDFRSIFGLPANYPQFIYNGPDPGIIPDEETEGLLDVEWSGAVAKGATIDFVVSQTTETTAGTDLSALYIVDNDLAPVMSESYGDCERDLGAGGNAFQSSLREQGAAEGITFINSAGDAGSARCDQGQSEYAASAGLAVSGLASTPFGVAVGGTDFGDNNNWAPYWNTTNTSNYASAKSYIPETTWNASCASSGVASSCSNAANDTPEGIDIEAAGGGPSSCGLWTGTGSSATCSTGYPKPAWQSGTGVPQDGVRDIPDISLFASTGTNGSFYVICQADAVPGDPSCAGGSNWYFVGVGGTSAAAPGFAGIMAMVNQKTGQPQGNANYVLYPLAAQPGASCTSNTAAITNANCIFYDVVNGNNSVACSGGSPNCSNKSGGEYGILVNPNSSSLPAWTTGTGYDLATGLGSLNVANLVNKWSSVSFQSTTTALSSLAPTVVHGQPANFTVSVTSGGGTPTGDVALIAQFSSTQNQDVGTYTLGTSGSVSSSNSTLPGGTYNIFAHYAGDGIRGASNSGASPITVTREASLTDTTVSTCNYTNGTCTPGVSSGVYGSSFVTLLANVTNGGGQPCASASGSINYACPTGTVSMSVDSGSLPYNLSGGYPLNNQGDAQITPISLPGGTYNLIANYAGDNNYASSVSTKIPVSITQAPTTTTMSTLPATVVNGNLGDITITVNTTSRGAIPTSQTPIQFLKLSRL